jgi:flagellar motor component MotA
MESHAIEPAGAQKILSTVGNKYTNVPLIPSLIVAFAGGSMSIALAYLVKSFLPHFYSLIIERGPVQILTVYSFWFTSGMLVFKYKNLRKERSAFNLDYIKTFTEGRKTMGQKTFIGQQRAIEENVNIEEKDFILVNRINKALQQIRINNNPADVANVLKTVGETDAAIIDSSYILIKYMIWAIPVLGFIGTILGMTQAIGSFDTVLKGINEVGFSGVKDSLGLVTKGLSVAFETTFLALVLSAVVNLFSNALQKKEEDLLSDVEVFTTENIVNKYSSLKDEIKSEYIQSDNKTPDNELPETVQNMLREIKNMNKQQQVNADQMMEQVGHVIEAVQALPDQSGDGQATPPPTEDLRGILDNLKNIAQGQADFAKQMETYTNFIQGNMQVFEKLPATIDEMNETSKKLGELFSKIYNRSFV